MTALKLSGCIEVMNIRTEVRVDDDHKGSLRVHHWHDHEVLIWALSISYHFVHSCSQKNSLNPSEVSAFSLTFVLYWVTVLDTISYPHGEHLIDDKWKAATRTRIWCCSACCGASLLDRASFKSYFPLLVQKELPGIRTWTLMNCHLNLGNWTKANLVRLQASYKYHARQKMVVLTWSWPRRLRRGLHHHLLAPTFFFIRKISVNIRYFI